MGALGSILGGLATSVAGAGFSAVTGLAGGLAKMILGAVTNSVRAGLSFIVSLPGRLIGGMVSAFQAGTSLISRFISGTFGLIRSAIGGALDLLHTGITTLTGASTLLVSGATRAVEAATDFGRSISDLRTATGSGSMGHFSAFGLKNSDIAGMLENQNPMLFGMKAGIFGLPGYGSSNFLPSLAAQYQSMNDGGMGTMMARARLRMLGVDNPQIRRIISQPVGEIVAQQDYQTNVQQGMGLNPGLLEHATRQFDVLIQRVKILADTALQRLGQELLPKINAVLKVVTDYFASNSGRVTSLITTAVNGAWAAFLRLARFLYADLPPAVLGIADSFLTGIETVLQAIPVLWDGFLKGVDIVQEVLGGLPNLVEQGWDFIQQIFTNGFQTLGSLLGSIVNTLSGEIQQIASYVTQTFDALAQHPLVQSVIKAVPAVAGTAGEVARVAGGAGAEVARSLGTDEGEQEAARLGIGGMATRFLLGGGAAGMLPTVAKYGLQGARWLGGGLLNAFQSGAAQTVLTSITGGAQVTLGGLASAATAPVVAGGVILGGLGYTGLQRLGVLGKDAPGFWEAANNTRKRITNLVTGQDYNYDVTEENGYTAIDNARRRAAQAATKPGRDALRVATDWAGNRGFNGGVWNYLAQQHQTPGARLNFGINFPSGMQLPFGFSPQGYRVSNRGAQGNFITDFLQGLQNVPGGSWSQSLDQRFGGTVRSRALEGLGTVQGLHGELRDVMSRMGSSADRNRQFDKFEKLLDDIANNTKSGADAAMDTVAAMGPYANNIIARAAAYNAQDAAFNLLRVS